MYFADSMKVDLDIGNLDWKAIAKQIIEVGSVRLMPSCPIPSDQWQKQPLLD